MSIKGTVRFFLRVGIFILKRMWVLFALLLILQLGILYIAVSEVQVPARITDHFLKFLEGEGIRCEIGDVRLRNLTVITVKDVRIDMLRMRDPLLRVRRCAVKLGPDALISGKMVPRFVYADGVEFFCPSVNSTSGQSELLISDGALMASRRDGEIEIQTARFKCGGAKFVAYGKMPGTREFLFRKNSSSENENSASDLSPRDSFVSLFSKTAGKISSALNSAELTPFLETGTLTALISSEGTTADFSLTALFDKADFSEQVFLKKAAATCDISFVPASLELFPRSPLNIFAENLGFFRGESFSERVCGNIKNISVVARFPEYVFAGDAEFSERLPNRISLRADCARVIDFNHGALDLSGIRLNVAPLKSWAFPETYRVEANAALGNSLLSVAGTLYADAENPSLNLGYEVSFEKKDVLAFPQLRFIAKQKDMAALRFSGKPNLRGNVRFDSGMKFSDAVFEFSAGEIRLEDKMLKALRIAGTVKPTSVFLPEIHAYGPDFLANADVFTEFSSEGDFRVRAWGTIDPSYIDGRLGWFWERIWRDLRPAPSETRPRADIDVYGNWADKWEYVFGAIAGENCWGNGVLVDKVRLRVYEDPLLIAAFDMGFVRGNDLVNGNLQWHYAMEPDYHYRDFRFLFNGTIPPKDVLQIVGEGLPEALSELETEGAGTAVVSGMFSGDPLYYPDRMLVNVEGKVPGAFSIFGIKGEDFSGKIIYENGVVFVGEPFSAKAEQGTVSGEIRVTLPEYGHGADGSKVGLKLDLKNVRRSRLTEAFSAIADHIGSDDAEDEISAETGKKETAAENVPELKEDRSSIDAVFAGTLTIPDIESLDASGSFFLKEPDLFKLQIFGGFSRMLSAFKIDLTTFDLNRAEGSYTVRGGSVFLPDLHVFGESGELNVRANVALPDLKIQGEAIFRNLRGTRIPLLGKIVEWGSASTELLPVKISGTLENFEWSVAPNITRLWSNPTDNYGVAPEKAAPDSAAGGNETAGAAENDDEKAD